MILDKAPKRCPQCRGVIDLQFDVTVDEPYLKGYLIRNQELPRRQRTAYAVAFCNRCDYAEEIARPTGRK